MKKTILIAVIACSFAACKKSTVTPGLFGKWELRSEIGGIAGFDSTFVAGNGTTLQFNGDSTYKHYVKGKLSDQGTFHIKTFYPPSAHQFEEILFNNTETGALFTFSGTQFTIGEDFDDNIAVSYQKISN